MTQIAKNRLKSTWTPLSNEEANTKIFKERRALVGKWFAMWSDSQRKAVLGDLLGKCRMSQIEFMGDIISQRRPVYHDDFVRCLPRALVLYIFSFLDPRSLCRAAQTCWHWKYVSELDQIWMPKAVRLGWLLPFSPSPYETGVWKRLYIENIQSLKSLIPKQVANVSARIDTLSLNEANRSYPCLQQSATDKRPPWKGSDPTPKDTWRNNYLDNDDEVQRISNLRKKHVYGQETEDLIKRAKRKVKTGQHQHHPASLSPDKKSRSMTRLGNSAFRPPWARHEAGDNPVNVAHAGDPRSSQDASVRPPPLGVASVKSVMKRTSRDPPTTELFPDQPWTIPSGHEIDSD